MRQLFTLLFLFTIPIGCGDTAQQRQAAQAKQNAEVAADLKAMGEAMHNDPNNQVNESAPDSGATDAVETKSDAPENSADASG